MHHTNNYNSMYPDFVPAPVSPPAAMPPPAMAGKAKRTSRGGKAAVVIFAAFLLLIGGTATAMLAFHYASDVSPGIQFRPPVAPPGYDEPYGDYYEPYEAEAEIPTTIQRADTAKGVTLTLHEVGAQPLSYQAIYEKCIPSIVSVLTTGEDGGGSGTGVLLTADGYLVTNYHVIQGGSSVEVLLHDGTGYDAKLVGGDQTNDLAVLKINAHNLTPAEFGDSEALRVGDDAFAIGNPLGEELRGTMTEGIVSAIDRDVHMDGNVMSLIQTSAALNPGNSGGALINRYGQVVGITNMKMMSYFDTIEGLGFAIPSTTTKAVSEDLLTHGHVPGRPSFGFTGYSLTEEDATEMDLVAGVYVNSVESKSDAKEQGLQPGDVITECGDRRVYTVEDINAMKGNYELGEDISFRIYRKGKYIEMEFALMERYELDW